ncbi:MAG: cytidylate kinase-like family protein [Erysipelotrichaceae bacterium]|nr:cytidylate kinase-like family protein [Erysipelotrichaceae bacterium]
MKKVIITIGRQYGSGGREIGHLVAERLNIPC